MSLYYFLGVFKDKILRPNNFLAGEYNLLHMWVLVTRASLSAPNALYRVGLSLHHRCIDTAAQYADGIITDINM